MSQTEAALLVVAPEPALTAAVERLERVGVWAAGLPVEAPDAWTPVSEIAVSVAGPLAELESEWVLYLRAGESIPPSLTAELARIVGEHPRAYGFRIRRRLYSGRTPVFLDDATGREGEIRLLYRRKARFQRDGRLTLQGTVVRVASRIHVDVLAGGIAIPSDDPLGARLLRAIRAVLRRPMLAFHPPTLALIFHTTPGDQSK